MLKFDLCCVTGYNAVSLLLHYNAAAAAGTLFQYIHTLNLRVCHLRQQLIENEEWKITFI